MLIIDKFQPIFIKLETGYKYAVHKATDLTINYPNSPDFHPAVKINDTGTLKLKSYCSALSPDIFLNSE